MQENNIEKFIDGVGEYRAVVELEPWKAKILLHIKTLIGDEDSLMRLIETRLWRHE